MRKIDFNKKLEKIRTGVIGAIAGILSVEAKQPSDHIEQILGDGNNGAFVAIDEYDNVSDTPYQEPVNIVKVSQSDGGIITFTDDDGYDRGFDDFNLYALIGIYEKMTESNPPVNVTRKD